MLITLFSIALLCLTSASIISLLIRKSELTTLAATLFIVPAMLLAGYVALHTLVSGEELSLTLPWLIPGAAFVLRIDPLAAFFILPIAVLSLSSALYAGSYLRHDGLTRSLSSHWFFFNIMVAAMLLVVTAANAVLFLVAWEVMTLSSFFLVAWDHQQEKVRKAAWLYLMAAHCGMMLLLALFIITGNACGSFNFSDFSSLAQLPIGSASLLYLLALFGFGVKAGLFPVHIWLPDAHPVAPSHVSALMSGVLIKTGIYGILRFLSFLPPAPAWWGWLLALLGISGALFGISLALQQQDIKRCLAYSTVENIGIIFLALGLGMVETAQGHPNIALFAYAGALLHLWNHALFKGVMFFGAGALLHEAGTRDMNHMGGLLRRMPFTGLLWIGGSLAIGALPPFNGLISEWLIYLGLLKSGVTSEGFSALSPMILIGLLGLVGALVLVTFSRLIGICLLGEPRDPVAANAHDASPMMLTSMGVLLAGCLIIGVFPQGALRLLATALSQVSQIPAAEELSQVVAPFGQWNLLLITCIAILGGLLVMMRRRRPQIQTTTWGCGYRFPSARMSYTGGSYAEFTARHLLPKVMHPAVNGTKVNGMFPVATTLVQTSNDPILMRVLLPLFVSLADRCQRLRWLQQGKMPIYLVYIFIASAVLMAWSIWAGGHGGG